MNILSKLFSAAVSLGSNRAEKQAIYQALAANPAKVAESVAKIAVNEARKRRLAFHANGCIDGYRRKMELVKSGKGKNTISGIPSWVHDRSN